MSKGEKFNITERGNVILKDEGICSSFNNFFCKTVPNLNRPAIDHSHSNLQNNDPILKRSKISHAIR